MNLMKIKITLVLASLVPALTFAGETPTCALDAAKEFGISPKVFKALVMYEAENPPVNASIAGRVFGPMNLAGVAIDRAAPKLRISPAEIKSNSCQNYRAAAYWLAVPAGGKDESDIWKAVNRYFYGVRVMDRFPVTEKVKSIYSMLR